MGLRPIRFGPHQDRDVVQAIVKRVIEKRLAIVIPVHNGRATIGEVIDSALGQKLPVGWKLDIILADDRSTDALQDFIEKKYGAKIHIIKLSKQHGRSAACNFGARAAGKSELIAFLDADCVYSTDADLSKHIQVILAGKDISCGPISVRGDGFWARYQRDVSESRLRGALGDNPSAMTTANMLARRSCFESIGGFDEAFTHYGFEDRDFILRALDSGASISICAQAIVIHEDRLTLRGVCHKARIAGQYSSLLFLQRHPRAYSRTNYAKADSRLHGPFVRILDRMFAPLWPSLAVVLAPMLGPKLLPFTIKRTLVKLVTGLAYLDGTLSSGTSLPSRQNSR